MDSPTKIEYTDKVCNIEIALIISKSTIKTYNTNYLKEAKQIFNNHKKVRPPTFVMNKKCASNIKKAGQHPIGIKSWTLILILLSFKKASGS